jgi:hypothetical protein
VIRTIVTLGADDPDLWVRLCHEHALRRREARTDVWMRVLLTIAPAKFEDKE